MKILAIIVTLIFCVVIHGQITSGTITAGSVVNATQRIPNTFVDSFDRADANPMTTTASDGVGVWTCGAGSMADTKISINILFGTTGTENGCRILSPNFRANQSCSIIIGNPATIGVMVRVQSPTDPSGYLCGINDSTHIKFSKVVDTGSGFTYTDLSAELVVPAINALDVFTFRIIGNAMEAFVNGVSVGTATADGAFNSGNPGIYFYGLSGSAVSFSATEL